MFHRLYRQVQPGQLSDFAGPQSAAVNDMLCVNHPFIRGDVPAAIGLLCGGGDRRMGKVLCTVVAGRFGERIGGTGRIKVAVLIIPQRRNIVFRVDQRVTFGHFFR